MVAQAHEKIFTVLVEKDEDGYYVGSVVELPRCHTQAKTMDQLNKRMREAIEGYLAVSSDGYRTEFVGVHQLKMHFSR